MQAKPSPRRRRIAVVLGAMLLLGGTGTAAFALSGHTLGSSTDSGNEQPIDDNHPAAPPSAQPAPAPVHRDDAVEPTVAPKATASPEDRAAPQESGDDRTSAPKPADDHGGGVEAGDDKGSAPEAGDDKGGAAELGDDHGSDAEPGDDHGSDSGGHGSDG